MVVVELKSIKNSDLYHLEHGMKRVLIIGSKGLLGSAIAKVLQSTHEVIEASRSSQDHPVDISNPDSLKALFSQVGKVDAIICTAGVANFQSFSGATDEDWRFGLANKLMGQVNVVRYGAGHVNAKGCILLTTGVLSNYPIPGSSIVTTVNAAVDGFVKSAALELKDKVRVNAVSPGWITETLAFLKMDTSLGLPAIEVSKVYQKLLDSDATGVIQIAAKG
jgi:NAD(P)-dependent dehydrogenase (short-subunit alcohol dehydrogenase family)